MKKEMNPTVFIGVFAGKQEAKGMFTVVSKKTGKDYTFKVSRTEFHDRMYNHIKVETGYLNFTPLGTYKNGQLVRKGVVIDTPAAKAAAWLFDKIEKGNVAAIADNVTVMHLGKCVRCGKTLTDAESIEIGLGPVCRNH